RFEDSTFYDKFERARQQTAGRILLMSQAFSQLQDSVTLGLLAVGVVAFSPWLLLLLPRANSAEGRRPSTGPEKRSAPRAGPRLCGAVASRGRPPARSLRARPRP